MFTQLRLYALAGVALVLVAMGIYVHYLRGDLARAKQEVVELTSKIETARSANDTNVDLIAKLKTANEGIAEFATAQAMTAETVRRERDAALAYTSGIRARAATELKNERTKNPGCEALLSQDLGAVCPDLAARLRQRSEALRPH